MNKAAHKAFKEFIRSVGQEAEDVRIIAPVLNAEGSFDGLPLPDLYSATDWFEIVEPLLYGYLFKVPGALIEGKAIIAAEGIIEASFFHLENPEQEYSNYKKTGEISSGQYKLLSSKLVVGPQKEPLLIEGEEFDDWLELRTGGTGWSIPIILKPYDEALWLVQDEDDPDATPSPALASEKLEEAAKRWRQFCETAPRIQRRAAAKLLRDEREAARGRMSKDKIAQRRQLRRAYRLEVLAARRIDRIDLKDPLLVCAVRTKKKFENRELDEGSPAVQVKITRMAERARSLGLAPKRGLRTVTVHKQWEGPAKECGLLLEPQYKGAQYKGAQYKGAQYKGEQYQVNELPVYSAPKGDFLFADEFFDENVLDMPSPLIAGLWSRNQLTKPDKRKRDKKPDLLIARSLERRRRDKVDARKRPLSVEKKLREMGDKYPLGTEPRTYLIGAKTGNLYPAKFVRYGDHLQKYLPSEFRAEYGHLFTDETVLARLLRQEPYSAGTDKPSFIYLPPEERLVVCFEDELVNVVRGQERMKMADLHRYLET